HQPIGVAANAESGIDVQLSGHTHGGMIRGVDQVVKRANGGYVSGSYRVKGMQLYVSNGTGLWNGFPIRLGVPAEITEFVLRPAR
ncbi:MAG TPA: metallophosphoesterase, partial [Massilia timonae]|nr:metallophosphoesterase [Massilia timonae]